MNEVDMSWVREFAHTELKLPLNEEGVVKQFLCLCMLLLDFRLIIYVFE